MYVNFFHCDRVASKFFTLWSYGSTPSKKNNKLINKYINQQLKRKNVSESVTCTNCMN